MRTTKPFLLYPTGKDYLWGGDRLRTLFGKQLSLQPLAETWECATHPDGCSTVASGADAGLSLLTVLQQHPDYLGKYANPDGMLPVLLKLIDAQKNLSVQVHPDDFHAQQLEHAPNGKTEMWYILEAEAGAELIYGFSEEIGKAAMLFALQDGTIETYLQKIPVQKGDVFLIPAGTVHAIGAGIVLAEIQQNCNLTYRLYDYNRTDKNGKKRELHIEKATSVLRMATTLPPDTKQPALRCNGYQRQVLCRSPYFCTTLFSVQTNCPVTAAFPLCRNTFQVLLCIAGSGSCRTASDTLPFQKGDCIFLPANCEDTTIVGEVEFLHVTC